MPFRTGLRALGLASLAAIAAVSFRPSTAAAAVVPTTAAQRVVAIAKAQLGKPYVFDAAGPYSFDCSGLTLYVFREAGLADHIGGGHLASGQYQWFLARGLASRSNPQVGDLVVYGGGSHIAIYIGNGRAISALNPASGVVEHGVFALHTAFTAFLHTHLSGGAIGSTIGSAALTSFARRSYTGPRVRTTIRANIRAGETLHSRILAVVPAGTRLRLLGTGRLYGIRWYRVLWRGRTAWVAWNMATRV